MGFSWFRRDGKACSDLTDETHSHLAGGISRRYELGTAAAIDLNERGAHKKYIPMRLDVFLSFVTAVTWPRADDHGLFFGGVLGGGELG